VSTTVAKLMVDTLAQAGVKHIFGVVGDSLNGFTDAMRSRPEMQWVHMRHEEAAAFAAYSTATAAVRLFWRSLPKFRVQRSAAIIFKPLTLKYCFRNAAIMWSWFLTQRFCRASWRVPPTFVAFELKTPLSSKAPFKRCSITRGPPCLMSSALGKS